MSSTTIELCVTWALFGLIWTIQLVHYPAFRRVAESQFRDFHREHSRGISLIVLPLMITELGLATWHWWTAVNWWPMTLSLGLVLLIWASTFLIQVPLHGRLAAGPDAQLIRRLVRTNWIRTILWTAKAIFLLLLS